MIPAPVKLVRIQALSGVAFAVFLSLHLANTAAAIISAGSYDAFQGVARSFYQQVMVLSLSQIRACAACALEFGSVKQG